MEKSGTQDSLKILSYSSPNTRRPILALPETSTLDTLQFGSSYPNPDLGFRTPFGKNTLQIQGQETAQRHDSVAMTSQIAVKSWQESKSAAWSV